jgi:hypothetical protein
MTSLPWTIAKVSVSERRFRPHELRLVARLEETARRAIRCQHPAERAVGALRAISEDPVLLGVAAGRARGRWHAIPLFHSSGLEIAALLTRAGADTEVLAMTAATVERRLRRHVRRG